MDQKKAFWLAVRIVIAAVFIGFVGAAIYKLSDLLVLAFGAAVMGVLLRSFARAIARHSGLSDGWALAAALIVIAAVFASVAWLFGARISANSRSS